MHITGEKRGTEPELSKHDSLKRQIKIVKLFIAFLPLSTHPLPLPLPTFRSFRLWHHLYDLRQGSAYSLHYFPFRLISLSLTFLSLHLGFKAALHPLREFGELID
jgi:hypothetical protein